MSLKVSLVDKVSSSTETEEGLLVHALKKIVHRIIKRYLYSYALFYIKIYEEDVAKISFNMDHIRYTEIDSNELIFLV